jgi:hypothetical protein
MVPGLSDETEETYSTLDRHARGLPIKVWPVAVFVVTMLVLYDLWPVLTAGQRRARLHAVAVPGARWADVEPILLREGYHCPREAGDSRQLVSLTKDWRGSWLFRAYLELGSAIRNPRDAMRFKLVASKIFVGAVALKDGIITSVDDARTY